MKNILYILISLTFFVSCQSDSSTSSDIKTITLSGDIKNAAEKEVRIYIDDEKTTLELTEEKFTYTFESDVPELVQFRHGQIGTSIFLTPGSEVHVTLDASSNTPDFMFRGDLALENNFWAAKDKNFPGLPYEELFKLEETEFIQSLEQRKIAILNGFEGIQKSGDISSEFLKFLNTDLEYQIAGNLGMYESYHGYFAEKKDFKPSELIAKKIESFAIDAPENLLSPNFRDFVYGKISNRSWADAADYAAFSANAVREVKANIKSPDVVDYVLYKIMDDVFMDGLQKSDEDLFETFKDQSINPAYLAIVEGKFDKWKKLVEGQPAPDFKYKDLEGNDVALDDLKGKIVYVDVWATWCGPCRAEHPALAELENQYHGNAKVAFVGVSIDEDVDAWRKMVIEKELGGTQIIGDKAGASSITKDYLINGIPRFILIDEEGNIMSASAPRPSSGDVPGLIDARLKLKTKEI